MRALGMLNPLCFPFDTSVSKSHANFHHSLFLEIPPHGLLPEAPGGPRRLHGRSQRPWKRANARTPGGPRRACSRKATRRGANARTPPRAGGRTIASTCRERTPLAPSLANESSGLPDQALEEDPLPRLAASSPRSRQASAADLLARTPTEHSLKQCNNEWQRARKSDASTKKK